MLKLQIASQKSLKSGCPIRKYFLQASATWFSQRFWIICKWEPLDEHEFSAEGWW